MISNSEYAKTISTAYSYTRTIFHNLLALAPAPTVTSLGRLFGHHFATLAIKIHQPTVKQPLIQ